MNDRQSLIAGVCAEPDDDAPRLVFADWLDEFGDQGDQAWAEFIRVQIELERLDRWSDRYAFLRQRAGELRNHLPGDFLAGFPAWAELPPYDPTRGWCPPQAMESFSWYRRGFRTTAWVSPEDFAARSDEGGVAGM